jgi:hypothetical protein
MDQAEEMQEVRALRLAIERLATFFLRLRQPTGLEMPHRCLERRCGLIRCVGSSFCSGHAAAVSDSRATQKAREVRCEGVKPGAIGLRCAQLNRGHAATDMATARFTIAICVVLALATLLSDWLAPAATAQVTAAANTTGKSPAEALAAYNGALGRFKAILAERRAQLDAKRLPNLPGQAVYLARNDLIGATKDLTDAVPSRIGRENKFGIPPAYFDAENEPLLEEYRRLFDLMEAPPANAQASPTPVKDVAELAMAIARAKGLDAANAEAAGRISVGLFFAETNGRQNVGNARSNTYKGSFQTGPSEDQNGRRKWQAIRSTIAAFDPQLIARDDREEARAENLDHRFNHWTAVRDALMNAHAELFAQIPTIVKTLPDPIDQMKLFELIQIVPSPTRSAMRSGNLLGTRVSDPRIMKYLRNNSMFAFGQADRARTSATYREIMDAMWLFNQKFELARTKFEEVKGR